MSYRILVTGSTGMVGREVVTALSVHGARVKAATRGAASIPGAEATPFDFERPETFEPALAGVDRVFLLIPAMLVPRADALVQPLVDAMKRAGVRRLVCMTGLTFDRPGAQMAGVERAVRESGIPWTLLRPNWFNQNFAPGFYLQSLKGGELRLSAGDARVSFVDTRDIGAVAAVALMQEGHDGKAYALTGPEALTHGEVCDILGRAAGREIPYVPVTDEAMRAGLTTLGMPPDSIEDLIDLYRTIREGACAVVSEDIEAVLGRASITFEQYAGDYAELLQRELAGGVLAEA